MGLRPPPSIDRARKRSLALKNVSCAKDESNAVVLDGSARFAYFNAVGRVGRHIRVCDNRTVFDTALKPRHLSPHKPCVRPTGPAATPSSLSATPTPQLVEPAPELCPGARQALQEPTDQPAPVPAHLHDPRRSLIARTGTELRVLDQDQIWLVEKNTQEASAIYPSRPYSSRAAMRASSGTTYTRPTKRPRCRTSTRPSPKSRQISTTPLRTRPKPMRTAIANAGETQTHGTQAPDGNLYQRKRHQHASVKQIYEVDGHRNQTTQIVISNSSDIQNVHSNQNATKWIGMG